MPSTASVHRHSAPSGPRNCRRHGPARAAAATTSVQPAAIPYSHTAGWVCSHHGTRLARKVPAGTAAANTPAVRHQLARRRARSASLPQKSSTGAMSSAAAVTPYAVKNQPWVLIQTCSAVSLPTSSRTAAARLPRSPRVSCEPLSPGGTGWPSQRATDGVRSVSVTIPGCLVDAARSRPLPNPGPLTTTARRCGWPPSAAPGAVTSSSVSAGRFATMRVSCWSAAEAEGRSGKLSAPRSTTVSGQRASTVAVSWLAAGRY